MEEYFFCGNAELCKKIGEVFEIKNSSIKNMIFSTLIEKICKKAENIKFKAKNEIESLMEKITDLEKKEVIRSEEIKNKFQNFKNIDNELVEQLENEVVKLKEKVK